MFGFLFAFTLSLFVVPIYSLGFYSYGGAHSHILQSFIQPANDNQHHPPPHHHPPHPPHPPHPHHHPPHPPHHHPPQNQHH